MVRCKEESCKRRASYNLEGEKAIYCKSHKKDDMIDMVSKRCLESSCKKPPVYNIEGGGETNLL